MFMNSSSRNLKEESMIETISLLKRSRVITNDIKGNMESPISYQINKLEYLFRLRLIQKFVPSKESYLSLLTVLPVLSRLSSPLLDSLLMLVFINLICSQECADDDGVLDAASKTFSVEANVLTGFEALPFSEYTLNVLCIENISLLCFLKSASTLGVILNSSCSSSSPILNTPPSFSSSRS